MANIIDYVAWRGDLSFAERPFNDVDNLILAELAYSDFKGIVTDMPVPLDDAWALYNAEGRDQSTMLCDPRALLEVCADSRRFGRILIHNYSDIYDHDDTRQFGAMTFFLEDGTIYVAFRGTDTSMAGWREDLNFSYMMATPAQLDAVNYLNNVCEATSCPVRVGGHSKGGNLAMFAAAFCRSAYKERLLQVYSNDGPGFNEVIVSSDSYRGSLDKVKLIIPDGSVVGILLSNKQEKVVVKSNGKDATAQHIPFSWQVERDGFEEADRQSSTSLFLDRALDEWVENLNSEERSGFVSAIFDALDASGVRCLEDLSHDKWKTYNAIIKAMSDLAPERKDIVKGVVLRLAQASRDIMWDEAKSRFFRKSEEEKPVTV